jgi:phosphate:Na+ symporter
VSFTILASLLGGLGLFLLGMRMMTDGLKLAAGNALRSILHSWTRTNLRGLFAGILITAIVQSSSAVTVATVGFVNAGLLTLSQSVWVIFGTNVGTTMTGWLVALIGVKIDVGAFALPLLGSGMLVRLAAGANVRRAGMGEAAAGFGAFFLGVGILQGAFADLAPAFGEWHPDARGPWTSVAFVGLGFVLTLLTQSSSAAIAIALTAAAGGAIPLELAAAAVIGTSVGTTSTALFASIGATAPAKRVASAHIAFSLFTGAAAFLLLPYLLGASAGILAVMGVETDTVTTIAAFHTLFKLLGVLMVWPLTGMLVAFLSRRFVSRDEQIGRPVHLDATLKAVPTLAVRALSLELARMSDIASDLARLRIRGEIDSGEARARQAGIARLAQAVRAFISELSTGPLSEDVVAALPDMLRASQHLQELASVAAEVETSRTLPRPSADAARLATGRAALADAVVACLDDGLDTKPLIGVEAAYEALKADLLRAGARGSLHVESMESDLLQARQLRALASMITKARRRLARWIEVNEPIADAEAGAADETLDAGADTAAADGAENEAGGCETSRELLEQELGANVEEALGANDPAAENAAQPSHGVIPREPTASA